MPLLGSLGAATAKGVGFTAVPAVLPGIPTIGTAVQTNGTGVTVSYTAPAFDGNTSILSYTGVAYLYPSGAATGITGIAYGPNSGSVLVLGLSPGTAYTFKVYATNGIGNSGLSNASNNLTTWNVPGVPTIGAVTYTTGNTFASVAFTAPVSNGGTPITSYTGYAYISPNGLGPIVRVSQTLYQPGSGSVTFTELVAGNSYTFRVYASNAAGDSPLSSSTSPATLIFTRPDAPTIGTATYTGGVSATVGFTAPANNGGASISSYTVRAYVSGVITALSGSGTTSPLSITGLTKGTTYTFRVTATNIYGTSDASNDSNVITPLTVPAAPTIGTPAATSGTAVNVNFTAPTDTGGNSTYITSYTATSTPGNISVTRTTSLPSPGATSVINIPGLTKGQTYTFTVYATNPIGNSANSGSSISVTPADVPNAPTVTGVAISTANTGPAGSVQVSYSAPVDNGGAVITSYTAVSSPGGITSTVSQAGSGTITVTGLTKGTAYTFVVYATNRVGNSGNSNTSSSITPITVPAAPPFSIATAIGSTSATVEYVAPTDTGGSTITNYTATASPTATLTQSVTQPGMITVTGGLTKGVSYTFTVTATNAIGTGADSSASNQITTWTEPGAPTIGTATEVNATTVSVTFTAGTTGGTPILNYVATAYIDGAATAITATNTTSPITITGLTQGTTYTFKVTASNSVGTGPASSASNSAQPADRPSKPTAPTVSTSTTYTAQGQVTVTFTAPYDGGTTITDYYIVSNPATTTRTITQAGGGSYLFTGLTKGTAYTFAVAARNRIGTGTYSDYSASITPLTVPNIPIIGNAARSDATSVTVGFTASTDNGGTPITSYTATSTPGGITGSSLSSPIFVTGLTKGTPYTFTVKANNSRGSSGESTSSNSATPATYPDPPIIGTATAISRNSASISFTAPADNGGSPITSYIAFATPGGAAVELTQSGSGTITIPFLSPATSYRFTVIANNIYGQSENSAESNQITTFNSYSVSASPTTINETTSRTTTFTINTIGVANGTTMFWTNTGTTDAADFTDGVNSGSFTISASGSPPVGSGTVSRITTTDQFTEGTQTIVFNAQFPSGTTVASATVNVNDTSVTPTPTYSIVENQSTINETTNRIVTFNISTEFVPNGTTLFWQVSSQVNGSDFTVGSATGSVTTSGATGTPPTGGTASFSLTATTDQLTEGPEAFYVNVGTSSPASSFIVAQSGIVLVTDTSLTPGVVTISPTTASQNIVKTGLALNLSGSFVITMASGTVGTITNTWLNYTAFSSVNISPTDRTFTAIGQTQTALWTATTTAVDYSSTSYSLSFISDLNTSNGTYPTHTITFNRIAYTQNISVNQSSGYTDTTFTYTVTGAPGTQIQYQNSVGGPLSTATLSGSVGAASAGTFTASGVFWITPGTYTIYVRWLATGHGDSFFGDSTGYATNTRVSVTVAYPPVTVTASPTGAMVGQIIVPFSGSQFTAYPGGMALISASGGSGGTFTYFVTSGALPAGLVLTSSGANAGYITGTPTGPSTFYSVTITATDGTSSGTKSLTIAILAEPSMGSVTQSGNGSAYTVGAAHTVTWSSNSTRGVGVIINGQGQGEKASNATLSLTTNYQGTTYGAGSYTVELVPVAYATNLYFNGTSSTFSYTLYAAPTASLGATISGGNSSTASSLSVKGGDTAYYNWTTTGAITINYYVNTNGGGFIGPTSTSATGPSGPLVLGSVTITANQTLALYIIATNAAGSSVQTQTATITWTPYNEVLSVSPSTTFRSSVGCLLTITGCYPNETINFSVDNTNYDGSVSANSSGTYTNPAAFQGIAVGSHTLYIRMATTTHTRQITVNVTA